MFPKNKKSKLFLPTFLISVAFIFSFAQNAFSQIDKSEKARILALEAMNLLRENKPESLQAAITKFSEAQRLYEEDKKPLDAAETMFFVGIATNGLGQSEKALEVFAALLKNIEKMVNEMPTDQPDAMQTISRMMYLGAAVSSRQGNIYARTGNLEKSIESLNQAAGLYNEIGSQKEEIGTLKTIAAVYEDYGGKIEAIDAYKRALEIAKTIGDKPDQSFLLNYIGKLYFDLQENRKALEYFVPVLILRRELKDRTGEGQTLANLGAVYLALSEYQKALENLLKALPIRREAGEKYGEAIALNNIGMVYLNLGENEKALEYLNQAAPVFVAAGDIAGEATALSNVGVIYDEMGNRAKALEVFNRVLAVRRQTKDKAGEATALNNLGGIAIKQGDAKKATDYFNQSLVIAEEIGDRRGEAVAVVNLGLLYYEVGRLSKSGGELREAITSYQRALTLYKAIGDVAGEADALGKLMNAHEQLISLQKDSAASKNLHTAALYGKTSINKYQELRRNIREFDQKTQKTYLKKVEDAYRDLAEILIKAGRLAEAQAVLNSFKDEQFFDLDEKSAKIIAPLALGTPEKNFAAAYDNLGERLGRIAQETNELKRLAAKPQPTAVEAAQIKKLDDEFLKTAVLFGVLLANSENDFDGENFTAKDYADVPDVRQMQSATSEIALYTKQKTVAVYQLVGRENLHLLIITPDGIKAVSAPAKSAVLQERALQFWALLQSPDYDPTKLGKELYDTIFKPLESALPKDTETILWSLDGNLRYIPMAALFDGKNYLVERYNHVNFTRADKERMTRVVKPVWTATGFGSSGAHTVELLGEKIAFNALPGVSRELQTIFKQNNAKEGIFEGESLTDKQFTKASFFAALKQKRPLVHIASHFAFRAGDEARSFLLLGDGTAITLDEMKGQTRLFDGVELLTLSACNTAAQQSGGGREVDAFSELAQRLGAASVMATLWQVSDNSTPWLMREFYDLKLNKNQNKAEALRRAQISLLNGKAEAIAAPTRANASPVKIVIVKTPEDKKRRSENSRSDLVYYDEQDAPPFVADKTKPFAHPYFWSPFILFGNWR